LENRTKRGNRKVAALTAENTSSLLF